MKLGLFYLIIVVLIITHVTVYFMGIHFERSQHEKEIDLTFEAATQQYKNQTNDTDKFDYYGNKRAETDTLKRVLPKNQRTELTNQTTDRNKKQYDQTRKRN